MGDKHDFSSIARSLYRQSGTPFSSSQNICLYFDEFVDLMMSVNNPLQLELTLISDPSGLSK